MILLTKRRQKKAQRNQWLQQLLQQLLKASLMLLLLLLLHQRLVAGFPLQPRHRPIHPSRLRPRCILALLGSSTGTRLKPVSTASTPSARRTLPKSPQKSLGRNAATSISNSKFKIQPTAPLTSFGSTTRARKCCGASSSPRAFSTKPRG